MLLICEHYLVLTAAPCCTSPSAASTFLPATVLLSSNVALLTIDPTANSIIVTVTAQASQDVLYSASFSLNLYKTSVDVFMLIKLLCANAPPEEDSRGWERGQETVEEWLLVSLPCPRLDLRPAPHQQHLTPL